MRNIKTTAFAPFDEPVNKDRYSNERDYSIGMGGNDKGYASRDGDKSNWSESKMKETGLTCRKPL